MSRGPLRLSHQTGAVRAVASPSRRGGQRGAVLITVSICLAFLVTATALTVDIGRLSARRRDLQAVADVMSLDLVRVLGGRTAGAILADPAWSRAVDDSRNRNAFAAAAGRTVAVSLGTYDARNAVWTSSTSAQVPKAVRVVTTDSVGYTFVRGSHSTSRSAIAVQAETAGFSIGSIGASLSSSDGALLNAILGDALDVNAIAYSGLVGGQVKLPLLAEALGLDLGNPNELLNTNLTLLRLINAEAEALRRNGDLARANLLDQVAVALPNPTAPITLAQLMSIETGGANAAAVASIDALKLLTATALVANGTNFLNVPALGLNAPGILSSSISLKVIEKPQFVFGPVGAHVTTSQVSLVAGIGLGGVSGLGGILDANVTVALNVANGAGTITSIGCGSPKGLAIAVQTSLVDTDVRIGGGIGTLVNLDLHGSTTRPSSTGVLPFAFPPDQYGQARRFTGTGLGLSALSLQDNSSLLGFSVLPVGALVTPVLAGVINPAIATLDQLLTGPLNNLLGLSIANADVTPFAVNCAGPQLAA